MSIMQSIIESVEDDQSHFIDLIAHNAIIRFCEEANEEEMINLMLYKSLLEQGKMSIQLENVLSESISPIMERYSHIYNSYLFNLRESSSRFNLSHLRNKLGSDVVLEKFNFGTVAGLAVGAAGVIGLIYTVRNPDEVMEKIESIARKTGDSAKSVVAKIKEFFSGETNAEKVAKGVEELAKDPSPLANITTA